MGRAVRPGPASLEGLRWLARVGPAPLDAWRCAMGWSQVAARSHGHRLERADWLARFPMTRGEGSLFVATRTGVGVLGLPLRAVGTPAPTWWAHHCGCAWAAAWLGVRGHPFLGDRELLEDPGWSGRISWHDHDARHRPDLIAITPNGGHAAIEVELAQKSIERLRAIITMYGHWWASGIGVIYICGDQDGCDRVKRVAEKTGLIATGEGGLRIELLETIKRQAVEASESNRAARSAGSAGELQPAGAPPR
jgi:hypothetical protein